MAFSAISITPSVVTQTVGGPIIDKTYSLSVGHTFALGEAVYLDSSGQPQKAKANSLSTSYTIGIVKGIGAESIVIGYQGEFTVDNSTTGYFPLVTGNVYYLSPTVDGGITATSPTTSSLIVQPLMVAKDSYSGIIINSIPKQNFGFTSLFTPVGTLVPYGGKANNIPGNWLLCAGDSLAKGTTSTDNYYDLYSAIGENYKIYGYAKSGSTGNYAYLNFNSSVEDAPSYGSGLPGSTKNYSLVNDDIYKITWGSKQVVAKVYSAVGTTSVVVFQFLTGITGATAEFTGLVEGTEVTVSSLISGEVAGYTSDKFFVPDLRGRVVIGSGKGVGLTNRTLGENGGEETHTLTLSEIPSHRHNIQLRNSDSISGSAQYTLGGVSGGSVNAILSTDYQTNNTVTDLTGGGQSHQNMQPYVATNWIIRYKSNIGQPGIEPGPKGDQGIQGIQGVTGSTGSVGSTGATGYGSGTIKYRYTAISTPPNGYWTETGGATGYFTLSSQEDTNINISSYIETWDNSNSSVKGTLLVRDVYNNPSFFRIYNITGVSVTGDTSGIVYYSFPVTSLVSVGYGVSGSAYNISFIPSANNGTDGLSITGPTGEKGITGDKGATGERGTTGADGVCDCPSINPPPRTIPTFYIDPNSSNVTSPSPYAPYNFSGLETHPTSFTYFKNSLISSSQYGFDLISEIRAPEPVDIRNIIKYNFNYSATGATPCDGGCIGSDYYYDISNAIKVLGYSTPSTQVNMVLAANKTYEFDYPVVVKDGVYGIYAQKGAFFSKTPTGISANYQDVSAGTTGRELLNIDLYADTNNISVGNYISLKPEHFGLTTDAGITSYHTICGLYHVNSVDYTNDVIKLQGRILGGITGARLFTGSLTYPNINAFDVYTTVVKFNNSSGFMVEPTGTLVLGNPKSSGATGDPFIIIHSGGLTTSAASKGLFVSGGKSYLGENMGFFSWPANGAAIYATNGAFVKGESIYACNNGLFVYADTSSKIMLSYPIVSRNNVAFILDEGKLIINGTTGASGGQFTAINNNIFSLLINNSNLTISDKSTKIIMDSPQLGLLANSSTISVRGLSGEGGGALVGATAVLGIRGLSLNNGSNCTMELDNITIRSSVTGNSIFGAKKRIGEIVSVYSTTQPIVAGNNFNNDKTPNESEIPPFELEMGEAL